MSVRLGPLVAVVLALAVTTTAAAPAAAVPPKRSRLHRLIHKAGWMGVGTAAHHFAGAVGSLAVGVAKYHEHFAGGWRSRGFAAIKIGVPIAIGATTGFVGSAAYEGFEHRDWIKAHWPWKKNDAAYNPQRASARPRRKTGLAPRR